jgi:hypothetical protein
VGARCSVRVSRRAEHGLGLGRQRGCRAQRVLALPLFGHSDTELGLGLDARCSSRARAREEPLGTFASVRQRERGGPVSGSVSKTPATRRSRHRVLPLVGAMPVSHDRSTARAVRALLDGRAPSVNPGTRVGALRRKRPGSRPGQGSRGRIRGRWSRARRSGRDGVRDTALPLARTRCTRRGPRQYATRFGQRGQRPIPRQTNAALLGPDQRLMFPGRESPL